jgi:hypothetical protein
LKLLPIALLIRYLSRCLRDDVYERFGKGGRIGDRKPIADGPPF